MGSNISFCSVLRVVCRKLLCWMGCRNHFVSASTQTVKSKHFQFHSGVDVNPADVRSDKCPRGDSFHRMSHKGSDETEEEIEASLVQEPVESNPVSTVKLLVMHQFVMTFRIMRGSLGVSREEVCSVLQERHGKDISPMWIYHFESFGVFCENMCQLKCLLKRWMDTTQTTAYSSLDHRMDGDLSNENLGSSSGEGMTLRISQEDSQDKVVNIVGEDGENDEDSHNSMVSSYSKTTTNEEAVPTSRKNHTGHIVSKDPPTSMKSLYSGKLSLVNQSCEEDISLEDMQKFVNAFQKRRLELSLSQEDVGLQLAQIFGRPIPRLWIAEFERFNAFFEEMCQLKPLLLEWMTSLTDS